MEDFNFDDTLNVDGRDISANLVENGGLVNNLQVDASPDFERRGDWLAWTPTIRIGTVTTTTGNGTFYGEYIKIGDMIYGYAYYHFGSTTNFGTTGTFTLPLPYPPAVNPIIGLSGFPISGVAHIYDDPAGTVYTVGVTGAANDGGSMQLTNDTGSYVGSAFLTWTVDDDISVTFAYRTDI